MRRYESRRARFRAHVVPTRWHAFFYGLLLGAFIVLATHGLWSAPHYRVYEIPPI